VVRVAHPLGALHLTLSPREAALATTDTIRLELDEAACLLLPDDLSGAGAVR
jgi:hypothetical protein